MIVIYRCFSAEDGTVAGVDCVRTPSTYGFSFSSFRFLGEDTNEDVVDCNIYMSVNDDADPMCADPVSCAWHYLNI